MIHYFLLARNIYDITAISSHTSIIIAIGQADCPFPIPVNGATMEPKMKGINDDLHQSINCFKMVLCGHEFLPSKQIIREFGYWCPSYHAHRSIQTSNILSLSQTI